MRLLFTLEGWAGLEDDTPLVTISLCVCLQGPPPGNLHVAGKNLTYLAQQLEFCSHKEMVIGSNPIVGRPCVCHVRIRA